MKVDFLAEMMSDILFRTVLETAELGGPLLVNGATCAFSDRFLAVISKNGALTNLDDKK